MARLKRYELYEGDGETIPEQYAGPTREVEKPAPKKGSAPDRRTYFRNRVEDDGLGAELPVYDDFEQYNQVPGRKPAGASGARNSNGAAVAVGLAMAMKHTGAWAAVCVFCIVILLALAMLLVPQLTGVRYRFLPNVAFANGSIITMDIPKTENFARTRNEMYTDRIYQGIYIDNVHVGGMTRQEAIDAVKSVNIKSDTVFDLVVSIGNESWHVNSERVPISRNVEELVDKALASGRSNTNELRGSGMTPFEERVNTASELRSYPLSFTTKQDYDHEALRVMVDGIANYVETAPVNSRVESFDFNTKTFTFSEDRPGARVSADVLYTRLTGLLDSGVTSTTVRVEPEKVLADVTRTELMNTFGLISAYTTSTTNNANRNKNIELSAKAINGITVMPGEIFSFNGATGERTAAKGYKEAPAISGGQSKDEVGGGVCQTSSTLFNAVVRADLEIIERNPHAWPSSYIEKGFDATVNWPGLDFRFRNNTEWPVFIVAGYSNRKITVNIYGRSLGADVKIDLESEVTKTFPKPEGTNYVINTSLRPGESKKTVSARQGYEVKTWKIWYQGSREIKREVLFVTTYKAYQETVEYNPQ